MSPAGSVDEDEVIAGAETVIETVALFEVLLEFEAV
jgi:hypothetical protein